MNFPELREPVHLQQELEYKSSKKFEKLKKHSGKAQSASVINAQQFSLDGEGLKMFF